MSKRSTILLLQDIQESIHNILDYTQDLSFEEFLNDCKTKDAVVRNFEVIGEAANKLPKEFINENKNIDYEILWKIKSDSLTSLKIKIETLSNKK